MRRYGLTLFIFCLLTQPVVAADINPILHYVPHAQKVGGGRLDYAIWPVYDASLYAPKGQYVADNPFALKLDYLRDITGQYIADISVQEMRRLKGGNEVQLAMWHQEMVTIFPNVRNGSSLIGIRTAAGTTLFFDRYKKIGEVKDPSFTAAFFAIWLDERTKDPVLRTALLGGS